MSQIFARADSWPPTKRWFIWGLFWTEFCVKDLLKLFLYLRKRLKIEMAKRHKHWIINEFHCNHTIVKGTKESNESKLNQSWISEWTKQKLQCCCAALCWIISHWIVMFARFYVTIPSQSLEYFYRGAYCSQSCVNRSTDVHFITKSMRVCSSCSRSKIEWRHKSMLDSMRSRRTNNLPKSLRIFWLFYISKLSESKGSMCTSNEVVWLTGIHLFSLFLLPDVKLYSLGDDKSKLNGPSPKN